MLVRPNENSERLQTDAAFEGFTSAGSGGMTRANPKGQPRVAATSRAARNATDAPLDSFPSYRRLRRVINSQYGVTGADALTVG
jgi:hypothetical protein